MTEHRPIPPGGTIGILGGGQLGRMLAIAAARLGLRCHIYAPGPASASPAADVAAHFTSADYDDRAALEKFARAVDVVTYEFENVPVAAADLLARHIPVRPGPQALATAQDRVTEKEFIESLGIKVAPWAAVDDQAMLATALASIGAPAILKTRRLGYDGKGQYRLDSAADVAAAWAAIHQAPAILEGHIAFDCEVSIIGARSLTGEVVCFDPGLNVHRDGILHTTTVPAPITRSQAMEAALICGQILNALEYVGVIGVELFQTRGGWVVNEIAPRVHNSGHWTIEACVIDQFQQHIRAIAGWPLGDGSRHSDALMTNLIGADAHDWHALAKKGDGLHLYGKAESRPGRKMGHITSIAAKS